MSYHQYSPYHHQASPADIYQQQLQMMQAGPQGMIPQQLTMASPYIQPARFAQGSYYDSPNNSQQSLNNYHQPPPPQQQQQQFYSNQNTSNDDYNGNMNGNSAEFSNSDLNLSLQGDYGYEDVYQNGGAGDLRQQDGRNGAPSRTVYLGNVPSDITPKELLDHVRSGIIENIKILPSKNCAFISFLDESSALLFHSDLILKRLTIKQNDIRIGWGKNTQLQPVVLNAVNRYGATRNVYLGNLSPATTEEELQQDLSEFGPIDSIKLISEKKIAFVHFTSILTAIRVVQNLPINEKYQDKKIFYGKDRCAFITKTQQHNAAQYLGLNPNFEHLITNADRELISTALVQQSTLALAIATSAGGANNLGNRTVYLGNLHPDSTIEEICNVVRGGILQNIRLISERHVCFITFIDPIAAAQFFAMSSLHGLIIHNRKIKIGWGKHSGPLSNALTLAVGNGASRNIYIGGLELNKEDSEQDEEELEKFSIKLRTDFEEFGEIEQINFFIEKNCAFINFTNISNAIKAIDGIKYNSDYENLKINFGKDRCGNIPRQFQNYNGNGANGYPAPPPPPAQLHLGQQQQQQNYRYYQNDVNYEQENYSQDEDDQQEENEEVDEEQNKKTDDLELNGENNGNLNGQTTIEKDGENSEN